MEIQDRLNALIEKHAPKTHAYHAEHGAYPRPDDMENAPHVSVKRLVERIVKNDQVDEDVAQSRAEMADSFKRSSPYTIFTLPNDRRRVELRIDDGEVVSGVGDTLEEAVAALEAK